MYLALTDVVFLEIDNPFLVGWNNPTLAHKKT